jgi:hypothetical protein
MVARKNAFYFISDKLCSLCIVCASLLRRLPLNLLKGTFKWSIVSGEWLVALCCVVIALLFTISYSLFTTNLPLNPLKGTFKPTLLFLFRQEWHISRRRQSFHRRVRTSSLGE